MKNKICKISLFSAILVSVSALPVDARVVVNSKNAGRSYSDAYNQVNAMRYQQEYLDATALNVTTASATATLPVMVSDEKLASAILNNSSSTTMAQLESCAMIYPNGVFKWEIPQSGIRQNQTNQCVAVVSLVDANTNEVVATTTLSAGDAMKCNIDSFPESGMNAAVLSKTTLPADAAPTMDDVEKVMNQEQKQNAGIKIAAGLVVSALAGNALSKKEAGNTGIIGTSKSQLTGTAIGAVTGAGIMAASTYTGKVAGDTIKSTAVNAASGAIIGNMLAGQSSNGGILVIKKCKIEEKTLDADQNKNDDKNENQSEGKKSSYPNITAGEHDCIVGKIEQKSTALLETKDNNVYIVSKNGVTKKCAKVSDDTIKDCENIRLADITLKGTTFSFPDILDKDTEWRNMTVYRPQEQESSTLKKYSGATIADNFRKDDAYFEIETAHEIIGYAQRAYIVFEHDIASKFGGHKTSELGAMMANNPSFAYMYRNSDGSVGQQIKEPKGTVNFTPTSGEASDGGLVDLSNPARTKGTIAGAAAGGALGGFAGYQGAQDEITDRWLSARREYEDSLSNFVCTTGTRYLGKYNDYIEIPQMTKSE